MNDVDYLSDLPYTLTIQNVFEEKEMKMKTVQVNDMLKFRGDLLRRAAEQKAGKDKVAGCYATKVVTTVDKSVVTYFMRDGQNVVVQVNPQDM